MKTQVIIAAAGHGERARQNGNKLFSVIHGDSVIKKTVSVFDEIDEINGIIIVYRKGELETIKNELIGVKKEIVFVEGGNTRFQSVKNGLGKADCDIVLIHDGARPFIDKETVLSCIESVKNFGTGIVAVPLTDTLLECDEDGNIFSSSRKGKFKAQTPQAFYLKDIRRAYDLAKEEENFTDDSGVYIKYIGKCHVVLGSEKNVKLTYPTDFEKNSPTFKVGNGFDLHILTENRKLILGGIEIPHDKGLLGHSDADVVTHAVMDALLASVSLRDIGYHFSDKDPKYKDANSMELLKTVIAMVKEKGYKPNNLSIVIMAQKPKLSPFVNRITENLANALSLPISSVGVTCTTLEGIGTVGREEGIAAEAYCSVVVVE